MLNSKTHTISPQAFIGQKVKALFQLLKFRLSLLVAVSAMFGYAIAAGSAYSGFLLLMIGIGGFMITGASNILNQISEKEYDKLMKRTATRPLPEERLGIGVALIYSLFLAFGGISIIGYFFNLEASLLGIIALLSYAFVYTPLKRVGPIAVFVGAIPGALPPLIGWVAVTGSLDTGGLILFAFQFFWQFPHFWAIAWLADEDYTRAGFKMMPSSSGKSKFTASLILLYTLSLAPLAIFPLRQEMLGIWGAVALVILALLYAVPAVALYRKQADKYAKWLLFSSFLYLPLIQLVFLLRI